MHFYGLGNDKTNARERFSQRVESHQRVGEPPAWTTTACGRTRIPPEISQIIVLKSMVPTNSITFTGVIDHSV